MSNKFNSIAATLSDKDFKRSGAVGDSFEMSVRLVAIRI